MSNQVNLAYPLLCVTQCQFDELKSVKIGVLTFDGILKADVPLRAAPDIRNDTIKTLVKDIEVDKCNTSMPFRLKLRILFLG